MDDQKIKPGTREKIGLIDSDPESGKNTPADLPEGLKVLRQATVNKFRSSRVRAYIEEQLEYVNLNRQVAESIKFFFDENNRLPANAPLHEIVAERKKLEASIKWFEAIRDELTNNLVQIKEIEDLFLDYICSQEEK